MRTMQQLENDMTRNLIADKARFCTLAIEAGNASDANAFAQATVRAARRLTAEVVEAELQAEPMLRLVGSDYVAEIAQAYSDGAQPCQACNASEAYVTLLAAAEEPTTVEINGIPVQLGVQQPPNDYRIFKGAMADFFNSAVANADALQIKKQNGESCG